MAAYLLLTLLRSNGWLLWTWDSTSLNIIDQLLEIWVVVHGWSHLYWFCILSLLTDHSWKHFFHSRIICRLYHNSSIIPIFVDTAMPLMLIFIKYTSICSSCHLSVILFESISHIESLLSVYGCSSWGITLYVHYIQDSTVRRLCLIVGSYTTCLCGIIVRNLVSFASVVITAYKQVIHVEQLHIVVVTCNTIGSWTNLTAVGWFSSFGIDTFNLVKELFGLRVAARELVVMTSSTLRILSYIGFTIRWLGWTLGYCPIEGTAAN
jgi:hypothetical protein